MSIDCIALFFSLVFFIVYVFTGVCTSFLYSFIHFSLALSLSCFCPRTVFIYPVASSPSTNPLGPPAQFNSHIMTIFVVAFSLFEIGAGPQNFHLPFQYFKWQTVCKHENYYALYIHRYIYIWWNEIQNRSMHRCMLQYVYIISIIFGFVGRGCGCGCVAVAIWLCGFCANERVYELSTENCSFTSCNFHRLHIFYIEKLLTFSTSNRLNGKIWLLC